MTTEQLDHLKIYLGAISGAISMQQEAILDIERGYPIVTAKEQFDLKNETLRRARNINFDLIRQIKKVEDLISKVKA